MSYVLVFFKPLRITLFLYSITYLNRKYGSKTNARGDTKLGEKDGSA